MTVEVKETGPGRPSGGVQSLDRAFVILETIADAGGSIGLSQLAEKADLPLATIHRLVRTLVDLGYVRQEASRQYSLGPRLMRLADTSAKRIATWAGPAMNAARTPRRWARRSWLNAPSPRCWSCSSAPACRSTPSTR
jgi:predicted transcriptional regulator